MATAAARKGEETRAIRVRALDGRSTTVRLAASCSVDDLKAALRASSFFFLPSGDSSSFHLFLKGAKLLPSAMISHLPPLGPADFVSLVPCSTRSTSNKNNPSSNPPPPLIPSNRRRGRPAGPNSSPWAAFAAAGGKRRKQFHHHPFHAGAGDEDDIYSPKNISRNINTISSWSHCRSTEKLDPAEMVSHLRSGLGSAGQMVHVEEIPGRPAVYSSGSQLPAQLSDATKAALRRIGVTGLYAHQALAQDQLKTFLQMMTGGELGLGPDAVAIYDGDTPVEERARIRVKARVLVTNPDMLHVSILPCHAHFRRFLSGLRHVVVDEAHAYRGAFGCHVSLVLRRLRRLCAHLYGGSPPTFVFCTATLANPREHAMALAGLEEGEIELVDADASPRAAKRFVLWNSARSSSSSPVTDVARLLAEMVQHGLRCIAFCKTRKLCEQVLAQARGLLEEASPASPELASSVAVYRGGYVAADRRRIEEGLFSGKLLGVAATNALELGIDVGHIDATLHLGFPGSMASLWQQAGRAGRRAARESVAVYVAFDCALDQYFMNFPQKLFGKPIEHCHVDARNPKVLRQHLACAAAESLLRPDLDKRYFGAAALDAAMTVLRDRGHLAMTNNNNSSPAMWRYSGPVGRRPASAVSIRAVEHDKFTVMQTVGRRVMEEIEESKAFFQVYDGAVYMHQGDTYLVERLDLTSKTAYCRTAYGLSYHTKPEDYTDIVIAATGDDDDDDDHACSTRGVRADTCTVTTRWVGYRRIYKSTNQVSEVIPLDLPSFSFDTQAVWAPIPETVKAAVEQRSNNPRFRTGVHGASHAILGILPLHMMCSSSDLGTECGCTADTRQEETRGGDAVSTDRILLYDKHPGGIGLAAQARALFGDLLAAALELVWACGCGNLDGCPNCVQSFACREHNKDLDKEAAVLVLKGLIQWYSES
ncbi:uncharacterized protein LOC100832655 [Brachypodium distachyon]|uniref:uncharacterized protein LOC100832655 n=1 Tax=Brachypodium distachyon TaxID=15368 RepID=UPI000D0D6961|nr:uncharacterized protein LOC100832655 [Brachypodium distachyon]|eukprot:XP_024316371.1 uncharacterized protein LOC100832655 [Brachypodium distachyon]